MTRAASNPHANAAGQSDAIRSLHVMAASDELRTDAKPMLEPLLPAGWRLIDTPAGANVILTIDVPVTAEMLQSARSSLRAICVVDSSVTTVAPTQVPIVPIRRIGRSLVAEFAVLLILALARRLLPIAAKAAARQWVAGRDVPVLTEQERYVFNWVGVEPLGALHGKTVGIVGLGKIGAAVAHLLRPFGVRLLYTQRHRRPPEEEQQLAVEWRSFDDLFRDSDIITLHQRFQSGPGGNEGQIGRRELQLMKPTAYLVNTSRGRLIDEEALADALRTKRIAGAGLDVSSYEPPQPDSPLLGLAGDNLILTAHVAGGSAIDWWQSVASELFDRLAGLEVRA